MNRRCIQYHDNHKPVTIMRRRYRRSVIVGRASYFSGILLRGSWLLPCLQYVRHQVAVASLLLLSLSCIPFFLMWVTGLQIWRFVLHFVIHRRHPELQIVQTRSLRCALDTHRWPGLAIALLLVDDDKIDMGQLTERILGIMQTQINNHLVLRRRLCVRLGCYLWREDDKGLDPKNQFSLWSKKANDDIQLQDIVSTISSKQLVPHRPPWEVVLIPCKRGYAVLLRAHHLIVDSLQPAIQLLSPTSCNLWTDSTPPLLRRQLALKTILLHFSSTVSEQWRLSTSAIVVYRRQKQSPSSFFALPIRAQRCISFPMKCTKFLLNIPQALLEKTRFLAGDNTERVSYFNQAGQEVWEAVKLVFLSPHVFSTQITSPVENVPLLRPTPSPGRRVLAWTPSVSRELVRMVAKASGASEVEVLLAACAGVLRQFLLNLQARVPESVSAILPVVVGERKTAAFALIDLPTVEWDHITRINLVRRQMKAVQKRPLHIMIGAVVMRYASCILPQTMLTLALNFLSRRHTITVCFVDTPIDVMPDDSRLFYWRPPQGNAGLTFTLQSNEESVSVAIASNQSVLSKPSLLTPQFSHEIYSMALALHVPLERRLTSVSGRSGSEPN